MWITPKESANSAEKSELKHGSSINFYITQETLTSIGNACFTRLVLGNQPINNNEPFTLEKREIIIACEGLPHLSFFKS